MVEWKKLGEITEIGTGSNNREDACDNGCYPFYVRSQEVLKIDSYLYDEEAILIPGEGGIGEIFHYVNGKYGLHQRTYRVHPVTDEVKGRYIYYYLFANFKTYINTKSYKSTAASIRKPMLLDFPFPIPSLEEQTRIVGILDTFTSAIDNLKEQIAQRRKQYEYYRDQLLDLEGKPGVEMKTLGDLFTFKNGLNKGKEYFGKGKPIIMFTNVFNSRFIDKSMVTSKVDITTNELERINARIGDVFFTRTSETQEDVGYASVLIEDIEECTFAGFLIRARPTTDKLLPQYCKYCFSTSIIRNAIVSQSSFTTRASLTGSGLSYIVIPVPSLEEQSRIVSILDTFEASIQNLEAQLKEREKQYEYYRNKLLTFE